MVNKPKLALLLDSKVSDNYSGGSYFHITAVPVLLEDDTIKSVTWDSAYRAEQEPWRNISDIRIQCQNSNDNVRSGSRSYAWEAEYYSPFSVDLDRAAGMVKTLKVLHRKLRKIDNEHGRAASFDQYLLRVAYCLGIKTFVVWSEPARGFGHRRDYRILDKSAAAFWVKDAEQQYANTITGKDASNVDDRRSIAEF